jgi:hypothetical protein
MPLIPAWIPACNHVLNALVCCVSVTPWTLCGFVCPEMVALTQLANLPTTAQCAHTLSAWDDRRGSSRLVERNEIGEIVLGDETEGK